MRAAIYARTANPCSEAALEIQVEMCRAYAKENNIDIIGTYCDGGVPAHDMTARDGLQRLLRDSAKGSFEAVIVTRIDRLARGIYNYMGVRDALCTRDVRIITVHGDVECTVDLFIEAIMHGEILGQCP